MNILLKNFILFTIILLSYGCKSEKTVKSEKPNIIIILSDDMGYSDIGCYGGEIKTPVLDELAANGLRFTQFYNTSRCCPTRASLLTGLYAHQASIGHMMNDDHLPGYRGDLGNDCVTIAEVMKLAGYSNYITGKWHVTPAIHGEDMSESSKHNWPLQRGFDRFYGTIHGAGSLWDPNSLVRDNDFISPWNDMEYKPSNFYYTDAISDNAAYFIREHNREKPFFMYVAYTAAHWPMHAPEEEITRYKGVYDEGYASIRERRYERLQRLGLINPDTKLSPQVGNWAEVDHPDWEKRCMETYAAMVTRMDKGIKKIISSLKETGQFENTLILFMQDNGGCQEGLGRNTPDENNRWNTASGPRLSEPSFDPMADNELQTRMIPMQTRDGYPIRMGPDAMPGPADTYIAYGINWANVSNTPFRMYKHYVHEGGISTPLIVHWPSGFEAKNELRRTPAHLIDIMTTCVDVAGADYPEVFNGNTIQPMEGRSLLPVFLNDSLGERHLLWEHRSNAAIRKGDWKMVGKGVVRDTVTRYENWELYNLAKDRSELTDLREEYPEKYKELRDLFDKEARRIRIFPSKY